MKGSILMVVIALIVETAWYSYAKQGLRGHLEPFGHQRESDGHIDIRETMMPPTQFWDEYCSIGKPVLLKGAASNMPAFTKWTDSYLVENYGDLRFKLESKLEKQMKPEGSAGIGQDFLKDFIESYRDVDKYMVSQLPDPLSREVTVPQCLLCGNFRDRILEANIWMSAGNTKSLVHADSDNALNCLLNGTKDWILVDPKYGHLFPVVVEHLKPYGGYTLLNVDSVDLLKFPDISKVRWQFANVSAGDCLFLPKDYWYQVRSYGEKNLAVSILVARMTEFENYGCPVNGLLPPVEALSDVPMIWTYDGYGAQTMGNNDPLNLNHTVSEMCDSVGKITRKFMEDYMVNELQVDLDTYEGTLNLNETKFSVDPSNIKVAQKQAENVFRLMDFDGDGVFSCSDERSHLTIPVLKKMVDVMDLDPGNTPDEEYKRLSPNLIKRLIYSSVSCELSKDLFVAANKKLKGSMITANRIFEQLDPNGDSRVMLTEVRKNLRKVLTQYDNDNNMVKDTSMESVKGTGMEFLESRVKAEF